VAAVSEIVVIGYGNPLRSDDAAGPRAAAAVAGWGRPGVRAIAVQQLTPELVEPLSAARLAIFVDARQAEPGEAVRVEAVEPGGSASTFVHAYAPRGLLALAQALCGSCPQAWLVTVPASDFAVGEGLSPTAHHGLVEALHAIARLLTTIPMGASVGASGRP
jgi:hydrogenase maturation protease